MDPTAAPIEKIELCAERAVVGGDVVEVGAITGAPSAGAPLIWAALVDDQAAAAHDLAAGTNGLA